MNPREKNDDAGARAAETDGRSGRRRRRRVTARRLIAAVIAIGLVVAAHRILSDFPTCVENRISEALSTDGVLVEISGGSFSPFAMSLRARNTSIRARHGDAPNAAILVTGAELRLRPSLSAPDLKWLREAKIGTLKLDSTALAELSSGDDTDASVEIPDFGPVAISANRVSADGLEIHDVRGTLSVEGGEFSLADAALSLHGPGEREQTLRGNAGADTKAPSAAAVFSGTVDFGRFATILREHGAGGAADALERFEFGASPPRIEAQLHWAPSRNRRRLGVSLQSGPMRFNGVRLSGFAAMIRASGAEAWERVEADPVEILRPEGSITGFATYDIDSETLSLDCVSGVNPLQLAAMAGFSGANALREVEFDNPSTIRCSGTLGLGDGNADRTALRISAEAHGATVRGFRFSDIAASGAVNGRIAEIKEITADAMGGALRGSLKHDRTGPEPTVAAALSVKNVPEAEWVKMLGHDADAQAGGILDANASYEGPTSALDGGIPKRGSGVFSADIRDAKLFRVPLFAGLTDVLARFVPGVDFLVGQDSAKVRATLKDGQWQLSELAISGAAFSIDGSGVAAADGSSIDIVARVRIMNGKTWIGRTMRRMLSPVSGLFGVRASGSIDKPRWTLAPFSRSTGN